MRHSLQAGAKNESRPGDETQNGQQMKPSDARPLIAVTTSEVRQSDTVKPTPEGEPPQREMALGLRYLEALETAGAIPIVTPPLSAELAQSLLTRVDAICLSGGPDLDPQTYGERRHERTGPVESDLDAFELALARAADEDELPILAICRGMQLLNVYQGGSLIPNLATAADHRLRDEERHQVQIEPGSALNRLVGVTEGEATSSHHQGVDRLGKGLEAVAWHADRTIEAIGWSDPMRKGWLAAVQWHPERMALSEPLSGPLFEGLLQAVRARTAS